MAQTRKPHFSAAVSIKPPPIFCFSVPQRKTRQGPAVGVRLGAASFSRGDSPCRAAAQSRQEAVRRRHRAAQSRGDFMVNPTPTEARRGEIRRCCASSSSPSPRRGCCCCSGCRRRNEEAARSESLLISVSQHLSCSSCPQSAGETSSRNTTETKYC